METAAETREMEQRGAYVPLKFSAETDRCGREHVGVVPVLQWSKHAKEGEFLVEKCEGLYQTFAKLEASGEKGKTNGYANGAANGDANGHSTRHTNGTGIHS